MRLCVVVGRYTPTSSSTKQLTQKAIDLTVIGHSRNYMRVPIEEASFPDLYKLFGKPTADALHLRRNFSYTTIADIKSRNISGFWYTHHK